MNKKLLIILTAVLIIAIGTTAVFLLTREKEADEGDQFLPAGWQADVGELEEAKLSIYFEARHNDVVDEVLEELNKKLKDDLNAEISFEFIYDYPDAYLNRIRQDIAAGIPCDAFYFSSYFPQSLDALAKEGLVKDITELFPMYAHNYYGQFASDDILAVSTEGKLYGIPAKLPGANKKCVIVRQDLMEKYSIPEIKSFDDYEVFLQAIKKNEPDMIPMNYWDTTVGLFSDVCGYVNMDYDMGLVYKWDSPSIKIEAWEQTPVFMEGIGRIRSWFENGYLLENVGIAETDERMIANGKWASFVGQWGDQFEYNSILRTKQVTEWNYKAYPLHDGLSARNTPMESGLAINEKSRNAERVLMFINWLQSEQEHYDMLMYGVKGKHYVEKNDYIEPPEGTVPSQSFFFWGWKAPFRNIEYERANFPGLKDEVNRYREVITKYTKYPPHTGFYPDYSTLGSIITARRLSNSTLDRYIYMGSFSDRDVEEYIKEQKDAGIDNLVEEIQKQLDQFVAQR